MRIGPSARRHGVADADIWHALRLVRWIWPQCNGVIIHVGPGRNAQFLEIGVILDERGEEVVIHAMKARPKFVP